MEEILLTIDTHRSAGRFSARWEEGRAQIHPLAASIPRARILDVDYSSATRAAIAREFFGASEVPAKDYRGGPFYSYFFGLHAAAHDLVLHTDSDMFFGGGSRAWLGEAVNRLRSRPEILVTAPLPGPPRMDGGLRQLHGTRCGADFAYDFDEMSTRLFLVNRRAISGTNALRLRPPPWKQRLQAWLDGNPGAELPEHLVTEAMRRRGLVRHDFLGAAPGMFSVHPPYRSDDFYQRLPELIARIERNDVPDEQRGDHDLNGSIVDWSQPQADLRRNRWWRRLAGRLRSRLRAGSTGGFTS